MTHASPSPQEIRRSLSFDSLPKAVYLHYPLCEHHCSYCDFNVLARKKLPPPFNSRWIAHLERQFEVWVGDFFPAPLESLYIGGGTPSLLEAEEFSRLCEVMGRFFDFSKLKEFSVEVNPESLNEEKLQTWLRCGVTRVSLGVQSFEPGILKRLERLSTVHHIETALEQISRRFKNFSVDLMLGIPDQESKSLARDLERALEFSPPHISTYLLTLAEDHVWFKSKVLAPKMANDETASAYYAQVCEALGSKGYSHYEVSNFALPGFESLHNRNYWDTHSGYWGFGPGAHGYLVVPDAQFGDKKYRYEMIRDPKAWMESPEGWGWVETLSAEQQDLERFYLFLRTRTWLDPREFDERKLKKFNENDLLEWREGLFRLTESAWPLLDALTLPLMQCRREGIFCH